MTNRVRALGYLGLTTTDLEGWRHLAGPLLGAQPVDHGDNALDIRLDRREWRLRVSASDRDDLEFAGWEVADDQELDSLVAALSSAGHEFAEADEEQRAARCVQRLVMGKDPDGNRVELFHSAAVSGQQFVSPHGASFVTGPGVGHMVLFVSDLDKMLEFYCGQLGLKVTDVIHLTQETIWFLRCNERHHSLALVPGRGEFLLQHTMLEVDDIDGVGTAFERCEAAGLAQSNLGRHCNDEMFSFYALAPGGYTVEFGAEGRLIDDASHLGASFTTTSWWGHRDLQSSR